MSIAQLGNGNGNGGGNGGGPGGRNVNDPCLGPRPPRNCNNVPINVDLLIVSGALVGVGFTIKNRGLIKTVRIPTRQLNCRSNAIIKTQKFENLYFA